MIKRMARSKPQAALRTSMLVTGRKLRISAPRVVDIPSTFLSKSVNDDTWSWYFRPHRWFDLINYILVIGNYPDYVQRWMQQVLLIMVWYVQIRYLSWCRGCEPLMAMWVKMGPIHLPNPHRVFKEYYWAPEPADWKRVGLFNLEPLTECSRRIPNLLEFP